MEVRSRVVPGRPLPVPLHRPRGKLDLWLRELSTGTERQLTNLLGAAAVSGLWSADRAYLAFLDQIGALYTVEVATGAVQEIYSATFEPGRPSWSADGSVIALAAIKPYSARLGLLR